MNHEGDEAAGILGLLGSIGLGFFFGQRLLVSAACGYVLSASAMPRYAVLCDAARHILSLPRPVFGRLRATCSLQYAVCGLMDHLRMACQVCLHHTTSLSHSPHHIPSRIGEAWTIVRKLDASLVCV